MPAGVQGAVWGHPVSRCPRGCSGAGDSLTHVHPTVVGAAVNADLDSASQ